MRRTLHLPRVCPHCGRLNDLHSSGGAVPKPGDLSVCWGCKLPALYTLTGMRKLTPAELAGDKGDSYRAMLAAAAGAVGPREAARRMLVDLYGHTVPGAGKSGR